MANNRFQFKRTSTSGLLPNTTNSANNSYIAAGEFAVNLTDKKVVSSDGSTVFEVGANVSSLNVTGALTANGSNGSNGQFLTSNGTGIYWSTSGGSKAAGVGLSSNDTHYFVLANTGIIANATGTFVNSAYISTLDANNATYLGGSTLATIQSQITGNAATAYTNATVFASNASNINSGTLAFARLPANVVFWSNNNTFTGTQTFNANVTLAGNTTAQLIIGTAADGVDANSTVISVGNATVFTTVNSTAFSGTANNSTNLGGSSLATVQGQITGNAATAYTNAVAFANAAVTNGTWVAANSTYSANSGALGGTTLSTLQSQITGNAATAYTNAVAAAASDATTKAGTAYTNATVFASNASNINSGTLAVARLPANIVFWSNTNTFTAPQTFNANVNIAGNATAQFTVGPAGIAYSVNSTIVRMSSNSVFSQDQFTGTGMISGVLSYNPEGYMATHPFLTNDLANLRLRGGAVTVNTNVTLTNTQFDALFDATPSYTTGFANTTANTILEFTLPSTLFWGSAVGISFGAAGWAPSQIAIDALSNGVWVSCYSNTTFTGSQVQATIPGNGGAGTTALRFTMNANTTTRIAGIWGYDYNSYGWSRAAMPRAGGDFYGNVSINSTSQLSIGTTTINATTYSGTSNNATNFGGLSLATVQSQITGNASTAYTNAVAVAASDATTKAGTAYTNAIAFASNASNINTGTLALARGGTNSALTAVSGGVVYSNATGMAITAAGTNTFVLASNGTAPVWTQIDMSYLPESTFKKSCRAATTADLAAASATTQVITGTLVALPAQDGVTLVLNDRLLVKDQSNTAQNGIYYVSNVGSAGVTAWTLTRTTDANTSSKIASALVAIDSGTTNGGRLFDNDFKATDTIGTTGMPWYANFDTGGGTVTGATTFNSNVTVSGNATNQLVIGTTTINATTYSGTANNATNLGGSSLATIQGQITGNAATAYTNAVTVAASDATTKAGTAYTNATVFASNASNINSGTLAFARLPANAVFWSNNNTFTGTQTFNANVTLAGNTTAQLIIGTAADGVDANSSVISVGNATVFTSINSTAFSGTANNSTNLGGSSLATIQGQITGNSATAYSNAVATAASDASTKASTAYSNAIAIAANATNLTSGTVGTARLGSGTANSSTVLYGNGVWAAVAAGVNTAEQYAWTNSHTYSVGGDAISFTNATNNRIKFNTGGVAAPAFTAYSNGVKIVLYDSIGAASAGYAIGIDGSTLWYGTSAASESHKWYGGTTLHTTANTSGLYQTGSLQAPIFYDSNDTNVRWDAGTFVLRSASPTVYFRDTDHNSAMIHCNSNILYVLRGANDSETWTQVGGYWPLQIDLTNNNAQFGGTITSVSNITAYSDEKLKENIITVDNALNKVMSLRGVYYTLKRDPDSIRKLGVIAQEVQPILPEVVLENENNETKEITLTVDYGNMVGVLIEAIKEQQSIIDDQNAKINILEAKLDKILQRLEG